MTQSISTAAPADAALTESQLAALARLAHAVSERAAAAVLVGPEGAGKSTVLAHLSQLAEGRRYRVVDDSHLLAPEALEGITREIASAGGPTVILAGQGRLLSLVARDTRLQSTIHLRAVVGAMQRRESRTIAGRILAGDDVTSPRATAAAFDTLHDIAGGMPRGVVALARLARVLLDEEPALTLDRGHVESLHRRLSMTAA